MGCTNSKTPSAYDVAIPSAPASPAPNLTPTMTHSMPEDAQKKEEERLRREEMRRKFEEDNAKEEMRRKKHEERLLAAEAEEEKFVYDGASMTLQANIRGMLTRARLAKDGNEKMLEILLRTQHRRKKVLGGKRVKSEAAVKRANSFTKYNARMRRAKGKGSLADRKAALNASAATSPGAPAAAEPTAEHV